jgi:hypothetical protein
MPRRADTSHVPAAELLSFLKQTRGLTTWSVADLAKSLKIPTATAKQLLPVLEIQGYIKAESAEWTTTSAGYEVSGSKMPRLQRESVEAAIRRLADWIKVVNKDSEAEYRVDEAVAFGDFMNRSLARVQAADVGIRLEPRKPLDDPGSAGENRRRNQFLKHLRGRSPMLNVRPYEGWMSKRAHVRLL